MASYRRRGVLALGGLSLACLWIGVWASVPARSDVAPAQPALDESAAARLRALADADELALAAAAPRIDPALVSGALEPGADPVSSWAALRLAPYLPDRDLALGPLARLAAGRDPELAPIAAWKLLQIAQELAEVGLERREIMPSSLAAARAAMSALAADASARPDVRLAAGNAAHLLGTLGVP